MKTLFYAVVATMLIAAFGFGYKTSYTPNLVAETSTNKPVTEDAVDEDIETLTYNLIHEKLTTPLRDKVKKGGSKKNFSRCPSGYQPYVGTQATTKAEYSYGVMEFYEGCDPTEVCNFRVRLSDKSVHILQSDSVNYVAVDLWLSNATSSIK